MKVGDLVLRKLAAGTRPGIIVEVIGDVAIVFWGHRNETHMYYFHLLEAA